MVAEVYDCDLGNNLLAHVRMAAVMVLCLADTQLCVLVAEVVARTLFPRYTEPVMMLCRFDSYLEVQVTVLETAAGMGLEMAPWKEARTVDRQIHRDSSMVEASEVLTNDKADTLLAAVMPLGSLDRLPQLDVQVPELEILKVPGLLAMDFLIRLSEAAKGL